MQRDIEMTLMVEHRFILGRHVLSAPALPEVVVARGSARRAYEDFTLLIGRWGRVHPDVSAEEFAREIAEDSRPDRHPSRVEHRFAIRFADQGVGVVAGGCGG